MKLQKRKKKKKKKISAIEKKEISIHLFYYNLDNLEKYFSITGILINSKFFSQVKFSVNYVNMFGEVKNTV